MFSYTTISNQTELQVYAKGNNTSKIAILFLHGGPGSGAQPLMDLPAFQKLEESYLCIYYDQRGSGQSRYDIRKGISIDDLIDDVHHVVESIYARWNVTSLYLWGGSFGGCIASLCIESLPKDFKGFILSSPAITFTRIQALSFFHNMEKNYTSRVPVNMKHNVSELAKLTPEEFFSNPLVTSFIFSEMNTSNSLKHICAMSSWFFNHPFYECLKNANIPTLVLQGEDDTICLAHIIREAISTMNNPQIAYQEFSKCGHAVFEDRSNEFVESIKNFIKKEEFSC